MIIWQPGDDVRETGTVEGKRVDSLIPCSQDSATETRDLEQIYREFFPALRAYLTRKVGNPEQAEDLVQETFYRALGAFQAGTGWLPSARKEYRPWLFRIATNLAIDQLRRRTRLTWCDLEAAATVPTSGLEADPEEVYTHLEEAETVRTTLRRLPEHYCTVLVLYYHHGLTASQVARLIGLTPGGCKMLLLRARHAFAWHYREQQEVSA